MTTIKLKSNGQTGMLIKMTNLMDNPSVIKTLLKFSS